MFFSISCLLSGGGGKYFWRKSSFFPCPVNSAAGVKKSFFSRKKEEENHQKYLKRATCICARKTRESPLSWHVKKKKEDIAWGTFFQGTRVVNSEFSGQARERGADPSKSIVDDEVPSDF